MKKTFFTILIALICVSSLSCRHRREMRQDRQEHRQDMRQDRQEHRQDMKQDRQEHRQDHHQGYH